MAVGILSIGLMLVATMFPVGIYLTTVASERTMAAIVADEAFAKIQLFGLQIYPSDINDFEKICNTIDPNEFSYPSVDPCSTENRQYYWSALCKKVNSDPADTGYLVTVFVARKTSPNHKYYGGGNSGTRPKAVDIWVQAGPANDKLQITVAGHEKYVNPPTEVVDNATGSRYRVIDREINAIGGESNIVRLDRDWVGTLPGVIWLVPPPQSGGKNADVGVFQTIIRF